MLWISLEDGLYFSNLCNGIVLVWVPQKQAASKDLVEAVNWEVIPGSTVGK